MLMLLEIIQSIETDEERELAERIFNQYYKHMVAKANSILNNHHDAEDAVMEAFRRIFENLEQFMNLDSNGTAALVWTYTKNTANNMYRRKKKQFEIFDMDCDVDSCEISADPAFGDPQTLIVTDETIDLVRAAIDRLDDKYREVILLKYYYHMKNKEIAQTLQIESSLVNTRIHHAKKKIKEILGEEGHERITY